LKKKFINPPELPKWAQALSQVVTVSNGGIMTIYLSGQVSVDLDNNVVGGNDLRQQADQSSLTAHSFRVRDHLPPLWLTEARMTTTESSATHFQTNPPYTVLGYGNRSFQV
jgi:hypothetical protein